MKRVWQKVRAYARLVEALRGVAYDFKRFYSFAGWRANMYDRAVRNYHIVKIYHSLEKNMSLKRRRKGYVWSDISVLMDLLRIEKESGKIGFHVKAAHDVIQEYLQLSGNGDSEKEKQLKREVSLLDINSYGERGVRQLTDIEFHKGVLESPEKFFLSRYSLREFKQQIVDEEVIKRSITLAMKSPSVCNRQAWHIYHTTDKELMAKALRYQSGNRGFGKGIPNLMIISTDLRAFMPGQEHYQHWIDGGLFAMSVIYALHSLGVATCCLNWSQSPKNDKLLRSVIDIEPSHTVIMMLAIGWPDKTNSVCVSARRPLDEIYTNMDQK